MAPTFIDLRIIQLLAPLQVRPFWVDTTDALSQNALVNGFVYAVALFLFWHFSEDRGSWRAQGVIVTILIGTVFGAFSSLVLQQLIHWPPPAFYPPLKPLFALHYPLAPNSNSFPSDSAILYSTVAFGMATWSRKLSIALLGWLLIFVEPIKIFLGGHYPIDILAGVLLGFCSFEAAKVLVRRLPQIEALASSSRVIFAFIFFLWLFEVGNEFKDISDLVHIAFRLL